MKKNILVIDPSIMIHKIVQLAFPEESYDVYISEGYPISCTPGDPVHLVLISADLPDQEDVHDVIAQVKNTYDAPTLLMIPKFHDFDTTLARQAGVDETIEKPFTSDALKEKVAGISAVSQDLDQMESLSPEELESITDDEFMLSEEDLMDIGEDDLADVEIPEDLPIGDEPDTSDLPEQEIPVPPVPDAVADPEEEPAEPEPEMAAETGPEAPAAVTVTPEGDMPFDDMDIEEDLDSIDFGDFEDEEQLLPPEMMEGVPGAEAVAEAFAPAAETEEEPVESEPEVVLADEPETVLEEAVEPEAPDLITETPAEEAPESDAVEPEDEPVEPVEAVIEAREADDQAPAEPDVPVVEMMEEEAEPIADEAEPVLDEDLEAVVEDIPEPQFNLPEEVGTEETVADEPEEDIDVNFAIEEEPQTLQMGSYDVEQPEDVPESEDSDSESVDESDSHSDDDVIPEPIDLSFDEGEGEIIPPPSSLRDVPAAGALSAADIDRIAKRVVELMGSDSVRQIAWEVIPVVAEEVVRSRIRELEGDVED